MLALARNLMPELVYVFWTARPFFASLETGLGTLINFLRFTLGQTVVPLKLTSWTMGCWKRGINGFVRGMSMWIWGNKTWNRWKQASGHCHSEWLQQEHSNEQFVSCPEEKWQETFKLRTRLIDLWAIRPSPVWKCPCVYLHVLWDNIVSQSCGILHVFCPKWLAFYQC